MIINKHEPQSLLQEITKYKLFTSDIQTSAQGRPLSQTKPFVRCSLVCESGVEVEPGKMFQSVLVHNSDTLKDMYCDVCAVY